MEAEEYRSIFEQEQTHWWYQGMRGISESLLRRYAPRQVRPLRILDAGCGTGGMMMALAPHGDVFGIDYSPIALSYCRRRNLEQTARASVMGLPFPDDSFDIVTSFEVLYHAAVADDVAAMGELRRVLRPGGLLLLRLPAFEFMRGAHDVMVHTRRRYTTAELRKKLVSAGFSVERMSYVNSLLFPLAAGVRLGQRLSGHVSHAQSDVRPVAPMLNSLLRLPFFIEEKLLAFVNFPVGLSALAVARKS
jgi:SAM-dependent methyltransferase